MVIIEIAGGLGNQMQQYALYRRFLSKGIKAKIDISWFEPEIQKTMLAKREAELLWFKDLPMEICSKEEAAELRNKTSFLGKVLRRTGMTKSHEYHEDSSRMYCEEIWDLRDAYVTGYYACNQYYDAILPELRKLFVFPEAIDQSAAEKNEAFAEEIRMEENAGVIPVSLHFRRGDYLEAGNDALFGGICTPDYYAGCVQYITDLFSHGGIDPKGIRIPAATDEKSLPRFHFYLFSDDPEYAETLRFGSDRDSCTVVDWNNGRDSMLDMKLMSLCRVNICANSTFSMWGARLNARKDSITIRPSIHRNTQKITPEEMHRYWTGWALVSPEGKIV